MKTSRRLLAGLLSLTLLAPVPPSWANPVGESLAAGHATFDRSRPGQLIVNQGSHRAIINWADFSIGRGEVTSFVMPSPSASVLNRVVGVNPSQLFGTLQGNGHVFVINPNGIFVGREGVVNTRSLTASTLDVADAAYLAGAGLRFSGPSTAAVRNEGQIRALGGDVFLIGHQVGNSGRLEARQGKVGLAAGSEVILQPAGNDRLSVVAGPSPGARRGPGVENLGTIEAVSAELKAAGGNIYSLAINNGGVIRATGTRYENGHVVLVADGGDLENSGAISAQNANGSGGTITLSAGHNGSTPATVINSGSLTARGEAHGTRGGSVHLLGDQVGVGGHALIDVSGQAGGGSALIGGDVHGANPGIQNAARTSIGADTQIHADALDRGDGGRVVVWADQVTRFFGTISARGGAQGGHGGFAEVSGKQSLLYAGTSDLRAPAGLVGDLLLDPKNIVISDTGDPFVAGDYDFSDNAATAVTIRNTGANSLVAALDLADVTLQANNDIQITHAIDASANANDHSLTLQAGRQILIDADITLRGAFTAVANDSGADLTQRDTGPANVTMGAGVRIDTSINGPHAISISYDNGVAAAPPDQAAIGNLTIGSLHSGGGAITLNSANTTVSDRILDLQGAVASGGGQINLTAGRLNLGASGTLDSGNGLITVTAVAGRNLFLGADGGVGTLSLDAAALARITTAGGLKLVTTLDALLAPGNVTVRGAAGPALSIDSRGSVTFDGGSSTFNSLIVHAGTSINLGANITTTGNQTFQDPVTLGTDITLAGADVSFLGALDSAAGTLRNLNINASGVTRFGGAVGSADRLATLTTDAPGRTEIASTIRLNGPSSTFNDAVLLTGNVTVDEAGAGNISFNGTVDSAVGNNFRLAVNTTGAGATVFNGAVGHDGLGVLSDDDGLGSLTTDAAGVTRLNAGQVRTTGSQDYRDAVTLGADTTLAGIDISFLGTVDSAVGTTHALTVNANGTTRFNGVVGGTDRLSALTTDAAGVTRLDGGGVRTTVNQDYHDGITFGADATLVGNDISFFGTVDSAMGARQALTVNAAGVTRFNGVVGGTDRLSGLTTDAAGRTELGANLNLNAPGGATFNDRVLITANTVIDQAGAGSVTFNQSVDSALAGNFSLTVNTPAGANTVFNGAVGTDALGALSIDTGLSSLTTDAAGNTAINGGNVRTTADQQFHDAVTLGADTLLSGANVWFDQTLNSAAGQLRALRVDASGATTFHGAVGAIDRLASLTTDGPGRTEFGGGSLNLNGATATVINDALLLDADLTINQAGIGSINLGTVDSRSGRNSGLTINTPGGANTVFNGSVGADSLEALSEDSGLGSLTTDGTGQSLFNGPLIRTTGGQNHGDALTLGTDVTLEAASVTLHQVTGGGNDLTATTDDLALTAGQAVHVARLTLQPRTSGREIDLGSETPGRLSLTQAELDNVTATVLQIGSLTAGSIFGSAPIALTLAKVPTLRLASGAGIDAAAAPFNVNNLAFQTAGDVTLTAANHFNTVAGTVTVNGRNVTICDVLDLVVGTVDGLSGIATGNHSALPFGNITLIADNLAINQRVDAGGGRVVLQAKTAGRALALGSETAGSLSLTAAELGQIKAGVLKIGNNLAGTITISDGLDFGANDSNPRVPTLSLESAHTIRETPNGWIGVQNLALRSRSSAGVVLDNPMNNWRHLGTDIPNGVLVIRDLDGYADASQSPNDIDGLTGVDRFGLDIRESALDGIAGLLQADVGLFWPTDSPLDFSAPVARPAGFEEQKLIWTSYQHLPPPAPNPMNRIRKIEEHPKWTNLTLSDSSAGRRPRFIMDAPMLQNAPR